MRSFFDVLSTIAGWLAFLAFIAFNVWIFRIEGRIKRLESDSDKQSTDKMKKG